MKIGEGQVRMELRNFQFRMQCSMYLSYTNPTTIVIAIKMNLNDIDLVFFMRIFKLTYKYKNRLINIRVGRGRS